MSILIITSTNCALSPISSFLRHRGDDDFIIRNNILTGGALLWPLLWYFIIGFNVFSQYPALIIAFIWPIALCAFQNVDMYHDYQEDTRDVQEIRYSLVGGIHVDNSTIVSFAFAFGALFWLVKDRGDFMPSIKLIVFVLLICITLIMPLTHFVNNNQRYTAVARTAQRVCVNYTFGLIVAALIMVLYNCSNRTQKTLLEIKKLSSR